MTQKLGFIGLGAMGLSMAKHLACKRSSEEQQLVVLDIDASRFSEFDGDPHVRATTINSDFQDVQFLFLCLPDGDVVEDVLFGEDGVASYLASDATVVDLSTTAHGKSLEIGHRLANQGIKFLDAPVSGAPAGAAAGTLTIMCGGDVTTFEAAQSYLDRMGKTVLHMGPAGSGQLTKTFNNVIYDINIAALAEILPIAISMELDPDKFAEVVTTGTSRSYASEYFVPRILKRLFDEGYPLGKAYKDLVSVAAVGAEGAYPLPLTAAATAIYQNALRQGHGDKDKGAMILPVEDLLNVKYTTQS